MLYLNLDDFCQGDSNGSRDNAKAVYSKGVGQELPQH